jgi:peroxiredoxin
MKVEIKSMLRNITSLAALSLLLVTMACKQTKKNGFHVSGTFKNADKMITKPGLGVKDQTSTPATKVYLTEISFGKEQQPIMMDSARLSGSSGTFSLSGSAKEGGIYELIFGDNAVPVPLIHDVDDITVDVDLGKKDDYYEVKGSEASSLIKELINNYGKKSFEVEKSFSTLDSLKRIGASDSVLITATGVKNNAVLNLNNYLKGFISSTNNPTLGVLALSWASQSFDRKDFEASLTALGTKYPNNVVIQNMKKAYDAQAAQQSQVQGDATWIGKPAPELVLPDVNGKNISLASFKGKYVLVDFWASWCGPCRNENPNVVKAYEQYKGKNFTILGVSLDKEKDAWKKAIQDDHLNWNQVSDLKYWNSKAVDIFKFGGIPFNILVDPDGKIIAQELRGDGLEEKLKEVLAQQSPK